MASAPCRISNWAIRRQPCFGNRPASCAAATSSVSRTPSAFTSMVENASALMSGKAVFTSSIVKSPSPLVSTCVAATDAVARPAVIRALMHMDFMFILRFGFNGVTSAPLITRTRARGFASLVPVAPGPLRQCPPIGAVAARGVLPKKPHPARSAKKPRLFKAQFVAHLLRGQSTGAIK